MFGLFLVLCLFPFVAILCTKVYSFVRAYRVRVAIYRRHGLASLVKSAKRNAMNRYAEVTDGYFYKA